MTTHTHTIHIATGEFCSSRNGDVAWVVGAFPSAELAAAACFADALDSSTESDIIVLPDGSRYVKDSVHDVLVSEEGGHEWDLDYTIVETHVELPAVPPAPVKYGDRSLANIPDGVNWHVDAEGCLLLAGTTAEAIIWIEAHHPGEWVRSEDEAPFFRVAGRPFVSEGENDHVRIGSDFEPDHCASCGADYNDGGPDDDLCGECRPVRDEIRRLWRLADEGDANAIHHLETFGGAR